MVSGNGHVGSKSALHLYSSARVLGGGAGSIVESSKGKVFGSGSGVGGLWDRGVGVRDRRRWIGEGLFRSRLLRLEVLGGVCFVDVLGDVCFATGEQIPISCLGVLSGPKVLDVLSGVCFATGESQPITCSKIS